jgi:hypothetical protein
MTIGISLLRNIPFFTTQKKYTMMLWSSSKFLPSTFIIQRLPIHQQHQHQILQQKQSIRSLYITSTSFVQPIPAIQTTYKDIYYHNTHKKQYQYQQYRNMGRMLKRIRPLDTILEQKEEEIVRQQKEMETNLVLERIRTLVKQSQSEHEQEEQQELYYCIKQHLWYRVQAIPNNKYMIEIGLAPRALEAVGDILSIVLYDKDGPKMELTSKRDKTSHYDMNQNRKVTLDYEEGELLFAITWEGIEQDKGDQLFYLVTGRNIWRCPIRGTATLNMEHINRNWTTLPPDTKTVLLYIECSSEDYVNKVSNLYKDALVTPDVENSTSWQNRSKKRIDKTRTTTINDPIENYIHPWVLPYDYNTYIEANQP